MIIFKENKKTGLSCGINDWGELFIISKGFAYYEEE